MLECGVAKRHEMEKAITKAALKRRAKKNVGRARGFHWQDIAV